MSNLNFNCVIIGGRLCADPELRQTQSGIPVATVGIAVNRKPTKKEQNPPADFFNIVAWQGGAEILSKYFRKGSSILVEGRLQNRSWTDQQAQKHSTTEIITDEIYFVDSKGENTKATNQTSMSSQQTAAPSQTNTNEQPHFETIEDGDDLPFSQGL